jgi:Fur family ferric uptake transcriptional regulator
MNPKITELNNLLLARGVRLTPQRLMVLEVLAEHAGSHITADKILAAVVAHYPYVDKTTVYRTLDLLRDHSLVVMTDLGGGKLEYELVSQPHHHIVCKNCGYTMELNDATLDPLRQLVEQQYGFQPCFDHFALFGVCRACREGPPAAVAAP